ncbi:flavodoxin [Maribacter litopenaei]|uniref:Flavodoxin n=1 Tax=Maribacter litopenaei TaxID=2976127 RepID=A0ABY5Y6N6_9FLAO|nr:flavodoxin [Maribacter litopenaei]UWX54528.1 flavodoxin [Maribacter litopenaei]
MRITLLFLFISKLLVCQDTSHFGERSLVVYLSGTKNTQVVAEMIHDKVGGDLVALELEIPYPEDYDVIVKQVSYENANGILPTLKTRVSLDEYETVFIGFPTWGMQLPPPIKSFLNQHDLSGKTVIPFNTNAGYGVGSGFTQINALCRDSKVLKGISIKGGIERDGVFHGYKR